MQKSFLWLFVTLVVIISALVLFQRMPLTRGYVTEGFIDFTTGVGVMFLVILAAAGAAIMMMRTK